MNNEIRKQLMEAAEPEYRSFMMKLIPGKENLLGIRMPALRKIAKKIAVSDFRTFLEEGDKIYFEETMLQGMVTCYAKMDLEERLERTVAFIPVIDNWATCDSFCGGFPIDTNSKQQVFEFVGPYLDSENEYDVRFSVVMLLIHFLDHDWIDRTLDELRRFRHEGYYARMAIAWALSAAFVEFPDKILAFLEDSVKDETVYRKTLQKIIESNRVDEKTKALIRQKKR